MTRFSKSPGFSGTPALHQIKTALLGRLARPIAEHLQLIGPGGAAWFLESNKASYYTPSSAAASILHRIALALGSTADPFHFSRAQPE